MSVNFGGVAGRAGNWLGKEIEKINPFSSTPESRADDFYKNAETKVFDCMLNSDWFILTDGYMTNQNIVFGQIKKLSLDRRLMVRFHHTGANLTCNITSESWTSSDGMPNMTACKIGNEPIFLCRRR